MLLEIEYHCEKETYRKQTETMGLQRRVKRGDAWFPLKPGKSYYNSLNQLCIEVHRMGDEEIEHNFEFGRPVSFFRVSNNQTLTHLNFTGTVSYVDGNRMVVAVPDSATIGDVLNSTDPVGVQLSFDETSYKTMFDALDRVIRAKGNRLSYLRDLFYLPSMKAQRLMRCSVPRMSVWYTDLQEQERPPRWWKPSTRH